VRQEFAKFDRFDLLINERYDYCASAHFKFSGACSPSGGFTRKTCKYVIFGPKASIIAALAPSAAMTRVTLAVGEPCGTTRVTTAPANVFRYQATS
jgi:hypothetical protein